MTNILIIVGFILAALGLAMSAYWAIQFPKIMRMHQDAMKLHQQELDRLKKLNK